jgi:hypothetical protein
MRGLAWLLALCLCSGCFVSDELDKGMETMNKNGRKPPTKAAEAPPAEEAPTAAPAPEGPGMLHELVSWAQKALEPAPPPPDPMDAAVRCFVGQRQHFSTRYECEARGGRAVELPPEE